MEPTRDIARGRWAGLLGQWLDERALAGRHTKCPMCGGKGRFRFDDKDGAGTWICSHCGAGDGFHLLQNLNGWEFPEAAQYVERNAGKMQPRKIARERQEADVIADLRRVWEGSSKPTPGDPVWSYLSRRCGIDAAPPGLRFHPSLPYVHDDGAKTMHPAMLAQLVGSDGSPLSIHRTYLTQDGHKANVPAPRKMMTPVRKLEDAAIRLGRHVDGWLGVAEGIETALCAAKTFSVPVWSCANAGLLAKFRPPAGVTLLTVFGDNDPSFTGHAAAYVLAKNVVNLGIECRVVIPEMPGDWADEYARSKTHQTPLEA